MQILNDIAVDFRLGIDGLANQKLSQFITQILKVVEDAGQVNPDLMVILQEMLQAQQRADYLWLADLIQYQLTPLLTENRDV